MKVTRVISINLSHIETTPPSIIYVARESNDAPAVWYSGKDRLEEGLRIWVLPRVKEYQTLFEAMRSACIVSGSRCRTYLLPAPPSSTEWVDNEDASHDRAINRNTLLFTDTIQERLEASHDRPTVISIGIDGWGADLDRIEQFLKRVRSFTLVVCTTFITRNGGQLSESLLSRGKEFWCGQYESEDVLNRLVSGKHTDSKVNELVAFWGSIQGAKEAGNKNQLATGRNKQI